MKGIQVYSNEGPRIFPRRDKIEIVEKHWRNLKIIFPEPLDPFQPTWHKESFGEGDSRLIIQMENNSILKKR